MRILAVSDLRVHDIGLLEKVAARVQPDLIVYGGDDVARFGPGPNSWAPLAARTPLGLAGVIGNDCRRADAVAFDQPRCHDLDRAPLLLDGLAILGLGGAPRDEADGIGPTLYTRDEAARHLAGQLRLVGRRRVLLVSHAPPRDVLDLGLRFGARHVGSTEVRDFIRRPGIRGVVCGHVHSHGGQKETVGRTLVVNIASHDHPGAELRYAILEWDGEDFTARTCIALDADAITRIRGIGWSTAQRLMAGGISNLAALVAGDGRDVARLVGGAQNARRLRAHARALRDGVPVLLAPDEPFPQPAVIVDVETSVDRHDDPWLVGLRPWGTEPVLQFEELDASRHADHLARIGVAIGRHPGATLVRWGSFDRAAITKAHVRVGVDPPAWLANTAWFDASAWVKRVVALPIDAGSLKSVARHFAYPFADHGIDGFRAGCWYTDYRDKGVPFDVAKVRAYNRDDVAAVEHVVRAVQELARAGTAYVEPEVAERGAATGAKRGGGNDVVARAVSKYAAYMDGQVASGDIHAAARDRAITKYELYMRKVHGG